ncbi:PNLIP [Branchiostoma lanceolatum]|uniref:PNLIP protein n=1 Tax=Branchiostoma lanceolatum TaxID=7740 RepID=A0A8K0F002_BRALA|nr:PNLIP [Branchiostoma lanceolatum]
MATCPVVSFPIICIIAWMLLNSSTAEESSEICMPPLGCLSTAPPFSHLPLPWHRDQINTRFYLRTRENREEDYDLQVDNLTSLQLSSFRPNATAYIVIHGYGMFGSGINALPKEGFFKRLLAREDSNVVCVYWDDGARTGLDYLQAAANARVVAAELLHFCKWLQRHTGIPFGSLHLIGFSFGAHVAGLVGHGLRRQVGRITALDPASPGYEMNPPEARLDHTDAIFVDVIHTDGQAPFLDGVGLAIRDPIGHVDFYPNGGLDQPGCEGFSLKFSACEHKKANVYFLDSVDASTAPLRAYRCQSYERFLAGKCMSCRGNRCMDMGMGSTKIPRRKHVKMFLQTRADPPCRVYHYSVRMHFRRGRYVAHEGHLKITLQGSEGSSAEIALNRGLELEAYA